MELRLTQKTGGYVVPVSKIRLHTSLKSAGILEWETPCRDIAPQNGDTVKFGEVFQGHLVPGLHAGTKDNLLYFLPETDFLFPFHQSVRENQPFSFQGEPVLHPDLQWIFRHHCTKQQPGPGFLHTAPGRLLH